MRARLKCGIAIALTLAFTLRSGNAESQDAARSTSELWFPVGEELIYDVHWGVIHAGRTRVTTEWVEHDGRQVIRIRYVTKSNRVVDKIYKVDDLVESLIDPDTFLPIYHIKRLNEGRYRCDEITTFDYERLQATWESKLKPRTKVFDIEKDTRDIVTFMYYLRQCAFETGQVITNRIMADEKLYDLTIRVKNRDAMSFPRYGKVRSFRLEPEAAFQGIFVRKGKLTLWVSDDERRIMTYMMATIPVANIRISLAEVRGPGNDHWVRARQTERQPHEASFALTGKVP